MARLLTRRTLHAWLPWERHQARAWVHSAIEHEVQRIPCEDVSVSRTALLRSSAEAGRDSLMVRVYAGQTVPMALAAHSPLGGGRVQSVLL